MEELIEPVVSQTKHKSNLEISCDWVIFLCVVVVVFGVLWSFVFCTKGQRVGENSEMR